MARRYMPEYLFNICVATTVRVHLGMGTPMVELVSSISKSYLKVFVDDDFPQDMYRAGVVLIDVIDEGPLKHPGYTRDFKLRHMQLFFSKYNLDGSKKRWRLLNGARFTGSREPVVDRLARFEVAYASFLILTGLGTIPLPTRGWRL